jgi:hypothetical protein
MSWMSWISWPITTIRAAEMALKSKVAGSNRSYLQFNTLLHLVSEAKAEHKKNKLFWTGSPTSCAINPIPEDSGRISGSTED